MKILNLGRGDGKTTQLVKYAAKNHVMILVGNKTSKYYVEDVAKDLKLNVDVITVYDFNKIKNKNKYNNVYNIVIDDVELVLSQLLNANINCVSTSCEVVEDVD